MKRGNSFTRQEPLWSTGRLVVLELHLHGYAGFRHELVDDPISFPVRGLDLTRYVRRPALSELFDLVGAVMYVYHGPEDGGHRETVTYHEFSRRWFLFKDDDPPAPLASFEAYAPDEGRAVPHFLFYRRRS